MIFEIYDSIYSIFSLSTELIIVSIVVGVMNVVDETGSSYDSNEREISLMKDGVKFDGRILLLSLYSAAVSNSEFKSAIRFASREFISSGCLYSLCFQYY